MADPNPFDQFDTPAPAPSAGANPFDQFDAPKQPLSMNMPITMGGELDPNLSLHDVGQTGGGYAAHVLGAPGDLEDFVMGLARKIGLAPQTDQGTVFPTSQKIGEALFGKPADERDAGYRALGGILGDISSPAIISHTAKGIASVGKELLPSATARSVGKLGELVGPAADNSVTGTAIQQALEERHSALQAARHEATDPLREQAFATSPVSAPKVAKDYRDFLANVYTNEYNNLSPEERALIQDSENHVEGNPTLQALDTERRRLNNIAAGKIEGYQAIKPQFAQDMAGQLTQIMKDRIKEAAGGNPVYENYLKEYAAKSQPLNLYDTLLGQRATNTIDDFSPLTKFDPQGLGATAFKSKQSVDTLKQILGDDTQVSRLAREYAANQLDSLTHGQKIGAAARSVNKWVHDNRDWLQEVPDVYQQAQNYGAVLQHTSTIQTGAKLAAGVSALAYFSHPIIAIRSLVGAL